MNVTSMDIKNRVFLITGGTSGVGKAIALGLARIGAKVVIISRTTESGQNTLNYIAETTGNDRAEFLVADLSLQSSIKKVSEEFKRKYDNLHVLVNLAGALFFEKQLTTEGIDKAFAVNYLSHFLLTNQLLDILKESRPSRVITVGGNPAFLKNPKIDLKDIQLENHYSGLRATSQAMFARMFFTFELAKRLEGTGVTSVAFHPGLITSNLVKNAPLWLKAIASLMQPWEKDNCEIGVYLAAAKEVEKANGVFFDDKKQMVPLNKKYDAVLGEKLWSISEGLTGIPTV